MSDIQKLLNKASFVELSARARAKCLLDVGTFRELLDPFCMMASPWLPKQNIVPQADDGVIIAKGEFNGQSAVVIAIEGVFQGGSMGEVGGAKIAGALELAIADNQNGIPTLAILLLETGGVRLQEANLGLAAIAEIQSAIVGLRQYQPVITVVAGSVGCFGGMSIAAGLCSYIVMTAEGRLGLNGPQVIEQEAGLAEYNAKDRPFVWGITGGSQRFNSRLVDILVADSRHDIKQAIGDCVAKGVPKKHRSEQPKYYFEKLLTINTDRQSTPAEAVALYNT
ncbi:MAG: biotin-independent malonate decarboxylase subunit beta [Moraxella sp.]|nr:biotin-independent malonate decarboxylase subunit beta [Moraxella sp.]